MVVHLLTLPLEIRTMILHYLLCSPTGHITLYASTSKKSTQGNTLKVRPHNPDKPKSYKTARTIGLAILKTCKQLKAEANEMIWKENIVTFQFNRPALNDDSDRAIKRMCKFECWAQGFFLRHIELCAFWLCRDNAMKNLGALSIVENCAQRPDGVLRSVILRNVSVGREDGWNMCEQLYLRRSQLTDDDMVSSYTLAALRNLGGPDGVLANVQRKMVFDIDFECTKMDVPTLAWWKSVGIVEGPKMMTELHDAFGGELWVNGRLWMRNGVEEEQMLQQGKVAMG
ncbi:hypothetical protein ONS95_007278 [Cadophora gregata]|uniref:uncharacterized protein n=1 Tax=Cadophora gregata TaxID=51156 RepID=UPI0026DCE332|nr:uncharacterized protein ONS95_007278 [Cadophora gregata]KAK0100831.1 hypothetical protein ONS95_007278 [Cadophora gregata]KAK0117176.1 hypothetical protein ONS96_013009 [Cadophora gregata f. sp. sojae]